MYMYHKYGIRHVLRKYKLTARIRRKRQAMEEEERGDKKTEMKKKIKFMKIMMYFDCIMAMFTKACEKKANTLLSMVPKRGDDLWRKGWHSVEDVIPQKLSAIPKPAFVSFASGAALKPGLVVTTDQVKKLKFIFTFFEPIFSDVGSSNVIL